MTQDVALIVGGWRHQHELHKHRLQLIDQFSQIERWTPDGV